MKLSFSSPSGENIVLLSCPEGATYRRTGQRPGGAALHGLVTLQAGGQRAEILQND